MFETEDMLPRLPPTPSAQANEIVSKPTVPEVSIIFGKPAIPSSSSQTNAQQSAAPPSYAAWKKQNLPRVTFPPNLKDEPSYTTAVSSTSYTPAVSSPNYITTRSNVFPMRTVTIATTAAPAVYSSTSTTCAANGPCRHELENAQILTLPTPTMSSLSQFTYRSEQRRSMDSLSQRSQTTENILTICASTQTDNISSIETRTCEHFKHEFNQLLGVIKDLREEQFQMRQTIEAFLQQQRLQQNQATMQVFCSDKATQCDAENVSGTFGTRSASLENMPPFNTEDGTLHNALPNVKIYSPIIKDTPRPTIPPAQSTTYRANTPANMRQNGIGTMKASNQYAQNISELPKPSTERSMVMNELALKYLPSEKLTELLQDTQITTGATSTKRVVPLRENDNFNKAPTDISNASYKYLRKYRLIPDQNANSPNQNVLQSSSPYQQRMQNSPIECANGSSGANAESPHLDLEHIRRQPKFL